MPITLSPLAKMSAAVAAYKSPTVAGLVVGNPVAETNVSKFTFPVEAVIFIAVT
jgi:hypothetical protein